MSINLTWPVIVATGRDKKVPAGTADTGLLVARQTGTITQNSTNVVDLTFTLPKNSQIIDFIINNDTAWNSGTSATLSIGTASGGTQYLTSLDTKTAAGRIALTATHVTGTQSAAWANITTNTTMVATITPSGATSAGTTRVTVLYTTAG